MQQYQLGGVIHLFPVGITLEKCHVQHRTFFDAHMEGIAEGLSFRRIGAIVSRVNGEDGDPPIVEV